MPTIKGFKMINGKITEETLRKMIDAGTDLSFLKQLKSNENKKVEKGE